MMLASKHPPGKGAALTFDSDWRLQLCQKSGVPSHLTALHFYTGERISNDVDAPHRRSQEALKNYVCKVESLQGSINLACRLVEAAELWR
jgi:hypothetical protein